MRISIVDYQPAHARKLLSRTASLAFEPTVPEPLLWDTSGTLGRKYSRILTNGYERDNLKI